MIALTGSAFGDIRCALLDAMVARALAASLGVWAPVFFMIVLLTFAATQRSLSLIEPVRERCFSTDVDDAAVEQGLCIRLCGKVNGHGSITFLSTKPDDLFDLCDFVLLLEGAQEVLSLRPRRLEDTFSFYIIHFDGEPLFPLQFSPRQGVQPVCSSSEVRNAFLRVDKDLDRSLRGGFNPHNVNASSYCLVLKCCADFLPCLRGVVYQCLGPFSGRA